MEMFTDSPLIKSKTLQISCMIKHLLSTRMRSLEIVQEEEAAELGFDRFVGSVDAVPSRSSRRQSQRRRRSSLRCASP